MKGDEKRTKRRKGTMKRNIMVYRNDNIYLSIFVLFYSQFINSFYEKERIHKKKNKGRKRKRKERKEKKVSKKRKK